MCKPRAILLPLAFSLISGLLLITARTSFAQMGPLSGPMGGGSSYGGLNNANDKPTAPPALPGAPALTPSTPSSARIPAGVSPTQALFQAIEAGKLDMAREALARRGKHQCS